jgi:hypothetical protein
LHQPFETVAQIRRAFRHIGRREKYRPH